MRSRILPVIMVLGLVLSTSLPASTQVERPAGSSSAAAANESELYESMLFGMGPAADQAENSEYVKRAPIRILSSWLNGANREETLEYMRSWRERGLVEEWWRKGYTLHIITYESPGSDYHISQQFLEDAASLAQIYAGDDDGRHPVLFSLATEFQTYASPPNRYDSQTSAYYDRLQRQLLDAQRIIKTRAPNARVSLSWGGWQVTWDKSGSGEGLSMIDHFGDTMKAMDFVSFQLMSELDIPNSEVILRNLDVLGMYNPHLMVAHYRPDSSTQAVFDLDLPAFFDDEFIRIVRKKGLFAFSFMDSTLLDRSAARQSYFDGISRFTSSD